MALGSRERDISFLYVVLGTLKIQKVAKQMKQYQILLLRHNV